MVDMQTSLFAWTHVQRGHGSVDIKERARYAFDPKWIPFWSANC